MRRLDPFDTALLAALQRNARQTADALSAAVGLSPAACQKRVKRLRDDGVIEREVAVLDPRAVGRRITVIVEVSLERERIEFLDAFKRRMLQAEEVMQCYYVTGESDFVMILTVPDMSAYEAFTRRHFFAEANVSRFRTQIVMDRVKVGLSVPLDAAASGSAP
ncbi:MAG: Lrp/AsnC family transcriptional regulator [Alphaproteobacteria bacterium]|nr:Lrp/AsnC family transcriptional regulator [Alphaproteobacteria bacterium]